jgi:hypothetical protein
MYLLLTTNGGRTQNTAVNKSPKMCKIGTEPIKRVLFATRAAEYYKNPDRQIFKGRGNERDDDATMAAMLVNLM